VRVALVMVTFAMLAGVAHASRPPTRVERAAIVRATKTYVDTSNCCAVMSRIKFLRVRVSTVNRRWAFVGLRGYDESGADVGFAGVVLHKGNLTGRWSVRAFGTSELGCVMPVAVRRDLQVACA
jgi:hypothetical protein